MGGNARENIWVVPVLHDEIIPCAVFTGRALRSVKKQGLVVALMSTDVSVEFVHQLQESFDMVLIKDFGKERKKQNNIVELKATCHGSRIELDLKFVASLVTVPFSKVIVIQPGVVVWQQANHLFDAVPLKLVGDTNEGLVGVGISSEFKEDLVLCSADGSTSDGNTEIDGIWKIKKVKKLENVEWTNETLDELPNIFLATEYEMKRLEEHLVNKFNVAEQHVREKDWVAVIGMACRFPGANSLEEYWDILKTGRDMSGPLPQGRLSFCQGHISKSAKANFLKCPVDEFDAGFFGISPAEATFTDPQARLILEVSWEAFEDAGINPDKLRGTPVSVFHGSWLQEYKEIMNADIHGLSNEDFMRKYLGNSFGCTAAKISFFYGFTGENVATESGCSSSMVAVNLACEKLLRRREIPLAVVTGANVILQMDEKQKILWAKDGKCRSFDTNANGYGRAEGIATLILKRYTEAVQDNNRIHGIILGGATTQEGLSKNFGAPTVESETKCMKMALDTTGVIPNDIDYLEAHATGTAVGDPIEAAAICRVYADSTLNSPRSALYPLWIGSGKTNIGHTEPVSGLAGIIKTLLAMKHEAIPPHVHLTEMNSQVNFDLIPGKVPSEMIPWPRRHRYNQGRPRIAGVSSFGITGTDVHIILREPPLVHSTAFSKSSEMLSTPEILTFSAKTTTALEQLKGSFLSHLTPTNLRDVTYSANTGRSHNLGYRQALLLTSSTGNVKALREYQSVGAATAAKPKICFTFPGVVGSMDFTPAYNLYESCNQFCQVMNCCENVWKSKVNTEFSLLTTLAQKWSVNERKPWQWYATAVAIQYSLAKLWMCWGIQPDMVLGQCMGELTAAVIAGALQLEDAFKILKISEHFEADNEIDPGAMMAINCSAEKCNQLIDEMKQQNQNTGIDEEDRIDVALVNAPLQTVVAASPVTLQILKNICLSAGIKCHVLQVKFAVHSRFVERACKRAEIEIFENINHSPCQLPYVSSVTGSLIKNEELDSKYWYSMFRNPVQFSKACSVVDQAKCNVYLEMGLGASLTALTMENLNTRDDLQLKCLSSFQKNGKDDNGGCWMRLLNSLAQLYTAGANVNWEEFYTGSVPSRQKIDLPHYPFQRKSFWFKRARVAENKRWEAVAREEKIIHPLLGAEILNCTKNSIFQSIINIEKVPYLYDHRIGHEVIFPAAGYVEMFLVACNNIGVPKSATLTKFKVHRPLLLNKTENTLLQTLMRHEENDANTEPWTVQVFAHDTARNRWILHASAIAVTFHRNDVKKQDRICWKFEKAEDQFSQHFYQNMDKVGLCFGPAFKSLSKMYRDGLETVVQVNSVKDSSTYLLHPILIDAMIQSFIVHSRPSPKTLLVPTQIENFTMNLSMAKSISEDAIIYVSCETMVPDMKSEVTLLKEDGTCIAIIRGLELVGTNINSMLKAAGAPEQNGNGEEISISPSMYDIIWQVTQPTHTHDKLVPVSTKREWVMFHDNISHLDSPSLNVLSKKMADLGRNVTFISILQNETFEHILEHTSFDMEGILFCVLNTQPQLYPNSKGILDPLLSLSKRLMSCKRLKMLPKFYVVTNRCWTLTEDNIDESNEGSCLSGLVWGFMRSFRMECSRVISKTIDLDMRCSIENWTNQLMSELWIDDTEPEICLRKDQRLCRRIKLYSRPISSQVSIPSTKENPEYTIQYPASKLLTDVSFTHRQSSSLVLEADQVEIEIRYCALNFKDVLSIISPGRTFEAMKLLGLDYSGIITKTGSGVTHKWVVGDVVFGCNFQEQVVASHTRIGQEWLVKIPKNLTFSEAATLPTVFLTAWYCMVNVAKLTDNQTVLIHAGTGGVGMCALQIAKMLGCNIICTTSSQRKRTFLRKLGVDQVFNSRSVDFQDKIRQAYSYQGILQPVDMVLNCLTGPGFKEASLELVRDGGHFVEISKLDVWTDDEIKKLRPLVNYNVVNIMKLDSGIYQDIMQILCGFLRNSSNYIRPLPSSIFPASDIVSALKFLQKANHIGKVLLELPCPVKNVNTVPLEKYLPLKQPLFNDRSTYFISGGKGTIGLAIVKWMISRGAKYLVLGGRSPANEAVKETLDDLQKNSDSMIICTQVDVSVYSHCKLLLQSIEKDPKLPPLRGIHHCAGILSDKLIGNQDWPNFDSVLRPKVDGAWNLHTISSEQQLPLEFFILHSSLCSTFGNVGQSNYVAANAYMDSLAEKRRSMELPAVSINWGKWATGIAEHLETPLLTPFSVEQGIQTLENIMIDQRNTSAKGIVVAGNYNTKNLLRMAPYYEQTLLEHVLLSSRLSSELDSSQPVSSTANVVNLKQCYWQQPSTEEKGKLVRQQVSCVLCETLGISDSEVEEGLSFADMGMDSLMSIEFTNKLLQLVEEDEASYGRFVEENDTVETICQFLINILEKNSVDH